MSKNERMHVDLMFPSKYLKAIDFQGKSVTKTIKSVSEHKLRMKDNSQEFKYIIEFEDTEKMLVLNTTNAHAIAGFLGISEAIDWPGHKITLYPTTCNAFGNPETPCIRVKGGE